MNNTLNKEFIDWSCEIKKHNYAKSIEDNRTIAEYSNDLKKNKNAENNHTSHDQRDIQRGR